ncbi:hypothetical protein FRC03_009696 [Tulasnella sp. 419]|nr:hypothetical protein FRC03_009696 [Tulasnella sp. 419]
MPPQLPQEDDLDEDSEQSLCSTVYQAAQDFVNFVDDDKRTQWNHILNLLQHFVKTHRFLSLSKDDIAESFRNTKSGDDLAFYIRSQNAGIVIRKGSESVIFELFEVSPPNEAVMTVKGRLLRSFPDPVIQIPRTVFDDPVFQTELARFLAAMDVDTLDSTPISMKSQSGVPEVRDTPHPRYITQLLTEILRGMGGAVEVPRVTKRIRDDILWSDAYKPWRRSAVWLVLRVALQTTLVRQSSGLQIYKAFIAYLHAEILNGCLTLDLPSYLIACMQRKLARRMSKLSNAAPPLHQFVQGSMARAQGLLHQRWEAAQHAQATSLGSTWAPAALDIPADTVLSLHNSRDYLQRALNDALPMKPSSAFTPQHSHRIFGTSNFIKSSSEKLTAAFKSKDNFTALADFERAVLTDLKDWSSSNLYSSDGCVSVATCITEYWSTASKSYSSNPELLSTMLLTLFKLWVELDRMTVAQCPLLAEFSPEIHCDLLQSLLLRTSDTIEAFEYVEEYLKSRHRNAVTSQSVLSSGTGKESFAVQYFDKDRPLQVLKDHIEETARSRRDAKLEELRTLKERHRNMMRSAQESEHKYAEKKDKNGQTIRVNAKKCPRCKLEKQAQEMKINLYEWPLPQDPYKAKIVIFELDAPPPFVVWRDITYMFLRQICIPDSPSFPKKPHHMQLSKYTPLSGHRFLPGTPPRLVLASTKKSFNKCHYKAQNVSAATEASVCVRHGLEWELFDSAKSEWVTQAVSKGSIRSHCAIQIPPGRYQKLQYAVSGTSHTSNDIMAKQTECPPDLTLHEFIAFCGIRSGPRLQWLNIISELRAGSLNFQEEGVSSLLRQAIWEMGPSGPEGEREWHVDLTGRHFGQTLLSELRSLLLKLKANRRNIVAMEVITALVSRLLASAVDNDVVCAGFGLLREVRNVTYGWLNKILSAPGDFKDESHVREWQMHICEVAATCRGTYDIDKDKAPTLLSTNEDVAIFVHCAILLNYNSPLEVSNADSRFSDLLDRDRRLAHLLEPLLGQCIARSRQGLDQAVLRIWKSYRPSSRWRHLPSPNNRWVTTTTAPQGIQKPQAVHLDLLSGQLLIDGKPLGRLPTNILTHPLYIRIFEQRFVDVIPSDLPGMDFKTSGPIGSDVNNHVSGYQIYFAIRPSRSQDGPEQLVIRTQRDAEILELIPHDIFEEDLPSVLVDHHTHWLNVSNRQGEIEIRDAKLWWKSSLHNWRINFSPNGDSSMYMPINGTSNAMKLVDPRSATMSMIAGKLRSLESAKYLVLTHSSSSRLAVSLPRFGLEFFLNDEPDAQLESVNIPDMIIDSDQSAKTMIGFSSQLVLRSKYSLDPHLRQLIAPYVSDPHFDISPSRHHVNIRLTLGDQHSIRYLIYTINSTLGRLDGDGTMLSKLYQIYLHALTSYCLPDPLTGRTGTEEALQELRSAGAMSFQKLGEDERRMLEKIHGLTPTRVFYPSHLKSMQTVTRASPAVCPLAQHHDFHVLSRMIWDYAETLTQLTEPEKKSRQMDSRETSDHLLQRAACHDAMFYRHMAHSTVIASKEYDLVYQSRGRLIYTTKADEGVVISTCSMIFHWEARIYALNNLFDTMKQYGTISGPAHISFSYGREWVEYKVEDIFLSAIYACRLASKTSHRYQMVFSLSAWAYASVNARPLIPIIFAFAVISNLRVNPFLNPTSPSYDLSVGLEPTEAKLSEIILRCIMQPSTGKKKKKLLPKIVMTPQDPEVVELVNSLKLQWSQQKPLLVATQQQLFDFPQLQKESGALFESYRSNKVLSTYFQHVQRIVDLVRHSVPTRPNVSYTPPSVSIQQYTVFNYVSLQQLVVIRQAPFLLPPPTPSPSSFRSSDGERRYDTSQIRELLSKFRDNTSLSPQSTTPAAIQAQYADDLEESVESLELEAETSNDDLSLGSQALMLMKWRHYQRQFAMHLHTAYELVKESLLPSTQPEEGLLAAGLWPCLTIKSLLGTLSSSSGVVLTTEWRKTLNSLARALLAFQHSCRLTKYLYELQVEEFFNEAESWVTKTGDVDGDELCSIQLLIQVDCNFLARPVQADFINEMTTPSSNENTVLQLNMGEGKSSVIVPIAAAMLSDGHRLVRVVVLRPLAPSMFQILVHRLGGLANRRIFYLPFSRTPRLTLEQAQQVDRVFSTCVQARGVLVVQPDHILSFRLMGLDRMSINRSTKSTDSIAAEHLLKSQKWLFSNSRDILDESDEILHVKYQLVYTVGQQRSLHGSPDRWIIAQEVLASVKSHAQTINLSYPDGFEMIETNSASYPRIRILRDDAGKALVDQVAQDILKGVISSFSLDLFPPELRSLALSYITSFRVSSTDMKLLEDYCKSGDLWDTLLILRGILAHGILQFVLKEKRWRVDYGPDISRSLLAVPYRAKDVPSLRAEFSHPDVAILLTCLSYYWQGLSQNQLEQCFSLLLKQDNPSLEYSKWTLNGERVPEQLRHLGGINLRDLDQRMELHSIFHQNQAVIDFFLSQVVFPRDAKEFPRKMATSGWDLAERKAHVTTGFSGTNDGRYLLPTSIKQADPLSQSSTNAKVLMYLLHAENDFYYPIPQNGEQNSEQVLLSLVVKQKPEVRVLLDVGAQILKFSNEEVAAEWLKLNTNPQVLAAVFFGPNDEPYVRTRNGVVEELISSPFRQQLDKCLLYLDDAHTRGTDFKLPSGTRAAVTLGPKVTKDRLVQGCMRMRRLGRTHTVMFLAPPEVDHSIRVAAGVAADDPIRTKDIVLWTMFESCSEVLHRIPQWAQQGMDYWKREEAWVEFNRSPDPSSKDLVEAWLQDEARSLDEMYAPDQGTPMAYFSRRLEGCPDILTRYQKWAPSSFTDTRFQEEQEREVVFEVQTERQVERPATAVPATHSVHSDLRMLTQTGMFRYNSPAFVPLFSPLPQAIFEDNSWLSPRLYSTKDFSVTIKSSKYGKSSDYLRPVNWILSSMQEDVGRIFVVLSPFEVNELLPDIRKSKWVYLHQYIPRITREMKSCEDLAFNCIPPLPASWSKPSLDVTTGLNLWAGQLYLENESTYRYLCNFLGLYSRKARRFDKIKPDGFIMPQNRYGSVVNSPFQKSPVPYLKSVFAARRKGMDYTPTHIGKILRGRLLTEEDFSEER